MKKIKKLQILLVLASVSIYSNVKGQSGNTWDGSTTSNDEAWRCGITAVGAQPSAIDPNQFGKFLVSNILLWGCGDMASDPGLMGHHEQGLFGIKGSLEKDPAKWIGIGRTLLKEDRNSTDYGMRVNWNGTYGIFQLEENREASGYEPHIKWGGTEPETWGSLHFDVMDINDDPREVMTLTGSGNLGINTTNPSARLHVAGSFRLVDGTQANGKVLTSDASGNASWQTTASDWHINGNSAATSSDFIGTTGNVPFNIRTNNVARLQITGAGSIGIGTATPSAKLHTVGNAVFTSTAVTNPASAPYIRGNNNLSTAATPDYTWWNNDQTGIFHPANNVIAFSIGGTEKARITSSGNLEIAGQMKLSSLGGPGALQVDAAGNVGLVPGGGLWSTSNAVDVFVTNTAGKVGIGTVTPQSKLSVVHNDANGGMLLDRINAGATGDPMKSQISFRHNNSEKWSMGNDKDEDGSQNFFIYDGVAGATRMFIGSNGNVGIGVTAPANKLEVCGTVKATQFNVAASWCDFVFEEDYKLKPLKEIDEYIQENNHLPNIPSAKEIEAKGVEVGTMISLHMQKIEELTLYIIQQEKKIQELETRLNKVEVK